MLPEQPAEGVYAGPLKNKVMRTAPLWGDAIGAP